MKTDANPKRGGGRRFDDPRIVELRHYLRARKRNKVPIVDPLRHLEEEDDRRRMQQNVAAAVIIVLLVVVGVWLIDHLSRSARIEACLEAGHHNCVPFDPGR